MEGPNGVRCSSLDNSTSVVSLPVGGSPISANSSDNYTYDDDLSMSDGSLYASDQENLSTPRRRYRYLTKPKNFHDRVMSLLIIYCSAICIIL